MKKIRVPNTKLLLILFAAIIMVVVLIFILIPKNQNKAVPLDLTQLKTADENYQYRDIAWESSVDDVIKQLDFEIVSMNEKMGADGSDQAVAYFESVNTFELDQQNAVASLEFQDNKLQIVKFDFHLDENHQDWFDNQVARLTELNGEASETLDNANEMFKTKGYKWDTEHTTLQIILVSGNNRNPSATIGVGRK